MAVPGEERAAAQEVAALVRLEARRGVVPGHTCSTGPGLSGGLVSSVASLGGLEAHRVLAAVGPGASGGQAVAGLLEAYPYLGFIGLRRSWVSVIFARYRVCSGVVYVSWRSGRRIRAYFPYAAPCQPGAPPLWVPVRVVSPRLWLVGVARRGGRGVGELLRRGSVAYYRAWGVLRGDRVVVGRYTSRGPRRENEDSHHVGLVASCGAGGGFAYKVCIVADGAGGVGHGREASSRGVMASFARLVDLLFSGVEPLEAMREAALEANRSVLGFTKETGRKAASTLAMCLAPVGGGKLYYLNIGDTAIHLIDSRGVRMLGVKHRVEYGGREVLSSYLGHESPEVASGSLELDEPAYVVLSTDGVYEVIGEDRLASIVLEAADPAGVARRLVEAAERSGSRDNMTAVVAYIPGRRVAGARGGGGAGEQ